MPNALYNSIRKRFLEAEINWLADDIKAVLVDTGNYILEESHEFLSDIPANARVVTSTNLTNKTTDLGAADADDVTFPNVSGSSAEAIVLYKDTGDEATSPLIAYIDTATGLPITPNGGDITITWDNGINKIFRL